MDQSKEAQPSRPMIPRITRQQPPVEDGVKEQNWPGTVMALGLFVSLCTVIWMWGRTFISGDHLLRWLTLFCAIGCLLPYARSGLRMGMERLEWFFFNLVGVGPLMLSAYLTINHWVHGPVRFSEHQIRYAAEVVIGDGNEQRAATLPWGTFSFTDEELDANASHIYRVGVARGCFGYWSAVSAELTPSQPCSRLRSN